MDEFPSFAFKLGGGRLRINPYDSPRVLRAVLEEILERLQDSFTDMLLDHSAIYNLQKAANDYCYVVQWRGISLLKLISIDVGLGPDPSTCTFTFRPLGEDGRWLLEKMDLVHAAPELPKISKKDLAGPKKPVFTRIVEI